MKSPVLFMIFKREDTTRRVFERIREAQPPRLYIAADGPRKDRPDEAEKCMATRKVVEKVDWPCEVRHLYRNENLGCGRGVSSAITWFFENEPEGIILEDDILPHIDFFDYCDEMLEKYRDDDSVQLISGRNAFYNGYSAEYTYYFSNLFHIWGWASWRRVWNTYQFDTIQLDRNLFRHRISKRDLPTKTKLYWYNVFDKMRREDHVDTWDYQFYFNQILYGRYSIISYINQIVNIGFNSDEATHTKGVDTKDANHQAQSALPIRHSSFFNTDTNADKCFAYNFGFVKVGIVCRLLKKLTKGIKGKA